VLAALRFQIVEADIVTRTDGLVVDTFRGQDSISRPSRRRRAARRSGRRSSGCCSQSRTVEALLQGRHEAGLSGPRNLLGTQVEIDNTTSDQATIVEVFADDRPGLLYTIARTLFELDLSIRHAKISTSLDQAPTRST
jgi:[protein-PII] uridylyltransferase